MTDKLSVRITMPSAGGNAISVNVSDDLGALFCTDIVRATGTMNQMQSALARAHDQIVRNIAEGSPITADVPRDTPFLPRGRKRP